MELFPVAAIGVVPGIYTTAVVVRLVYIPGTLARHCQRLASVPGWK